MKKYILLFASLLAVSNGIHAFTPQISTFTGSGDPANNYFKWPEKGQMVWGDYNNDGFQDAFLISGGWTILYVNQNGTLTGFDPSIKGLKQAAAVFLDYNNDGNLDLMISGRDGDSGPFITKLYTNSGAPGYTFSEDTRSVFEGVYGEDHPTRLLSVVDFNNDGWDDVLIHGGGNGRILKLYKNNGGVFSEVTRPVDGTSAFPSLNGGTASWGDIDRDGYMDFVVSGYENGSSTYVFRNNGNETFSKLATLNGQYGGETTMVDVNNDGYPDIVESGYGAAFETYLYINNQDKTFTKMKSDLAGERLMSVGYGDFNNDGWVDFVESYNNSGYNPFTDLFYNNGDNTFTRQGDALVNVRSGFVSVADINNDGNQDIYVGGYGNGYQWDFFLNNTEEVYDAPMIPGNVMAELVGDTVVVTWDRSSDSKMPQDAVMYNVIVKCGAEFVHALVPADLESGRLKISGPQPFTTHTEYRLSGLKDGTYTVGVQSVNHARRVSPFAVTTVVKSTVGLQNTNLQHVLVSAGDRSVIIRNQESQGIDYQVVSTNGQLLANGHCEAGQEIVLPMTAEGVYVVKCATAQGCQTVKIVL